MIPLRLACPYRSSEIDRFNKYKTLLHIPLFSTSHLYIEIDVTSAICYHTLVFYICKTQAERERERERKTNLNFLINFRTSSVYPRNLNNLKIIRQKQSLSKSVSLKIHCLFRSFKSVKTYLLCVFQKFSIVE